MPPTHGPATRDLRRISAGTISSSVRLCAVWRRSFAVGFEGGAAVEGGAVVVAPGAGVTAGPVGAAADGGGVGGEGDGTGVAEVGGAAASLDGGVSRFSKKVLTDDVTASQRSRAALTPPAYPETRRPSPARSRKPLNSSTASSAIVRKRIGCCKG